MADGQLKATSQALDLLAEALRFAQNDLYAFTGEFTSDDLLGVIFGQHLLRYRLERACEGLARPGALAKEVAYAVGFNDLSYFSWAFKRQLGVCPRDYQASAR